MNIKRWLKSSYHSLSTKLLLLFLLSGLIMIVILSLVLTRGFSQHFKHNVRPLMVHYIKLIENEIGSPPDFEKAKQIVENVPIDIHIYGPNVAWSTTGSTPPPLKKLKRLFKHKYRSDLHNDNGLVMGKSFDTRRPFRSRLRRSENGHVFMSQNDQYIHVFEITEKRRFKNIPFKLIFLLTTIAVLLLIYFATRKLFRPIDDINHGVQTISKGNFKHRIPIYRADQLGDLAHSVNNMASEIETILEAKRQLLLAISHELRSPLTRSKVNLMLLESSKPMQEISKDINLMDALINELIEGERLNSQHVSLNKQATKIDTLIEDVIANNFSQNEVHAQLKPVHAMVDPARIKLLIRNLLENAVMYNSSSTLPIITLQPQANVWQIQVIDFGQGIDEADIPHLTEPFYRVDPSRQRKTGGYGLGLYLCNMIVKAHQGEMQIESIKGEGTTITCRFNSFNKKLNLAVDV